MIPKRVDRKGLLGPSNGNTCRILLEMKDFTVYQSLYREKSESHEIQKPKYLLVHSSHISTFPFNCFFLHVVYILVKSTGIETENKYYTRNEKQKKKGAEK